MTWRGIRAILSGGRSRLAFVDRFTTVIERCLALELPLGEGLRRAAQSDGWQGYRDVVVDVAERCERGDALSVALARWPECFDASYRTAVRAGERSSSLSSTIDGLLNEVRIRRELAEMFHGAVRYPKLVLVALVTSLALTGWLAVPSFIDWLQAGGQSAPFAVHVFAAVARSSPLLLALVGVLTAVVLSSTFESLSPPIALTVARVRLRIPVFGRFEQILIRSAALRSLATLLDLGVPFDQALSSVAEGITNPAARADLEAHAAAITAGGRLSDAVTRDGLLGSFAATFLDAAWGGHDLPRAMRSISASDERELRLTLQRSGMLLEIIVLVPVGIACGLALAAQFGLYFHAVGQGFAP